MITLHKKGAFLQGGQTVAPAIPAGAARRNTIAYQILSAHNINEEMDHLRLRFDSLTANDMYAPDILQLARGAGMDAFSLPFVLSNCRYSTCAERGTVHADQHRFARSAAEKYGGIYIPPYLAVSHCYNREAMTACGRMILGSDRHTRYGPLGTMGTSGNEEALLRQLQGFSYDRALPQVIAVRLAGKPRPGVGPMDVALSILGAVYQNEFAKDAVLEFIWEEGCSLPVEYRNGIDAMMPETGCWSTIWQTDEAVQEYFAIHGRPNAFRQLEPVSIAYYDGLVDVDLDTIEPMIALPFHPGNTFTLAAFMQNAGDILRETERTAVQLLDGRGRTPDLTGKVRGGAVYVDQGIVAGCTGGTFDNLCEMSEILRGRSVGNGPYTLGLYPGSQPIYMELLRKGIAPQLMRAGAMLHECCCGPCVGVSETPPSGALSIRHVPRNTPGREGSRLSEGELACVALMDARSIAATSIHGGRLTSALEVRIWDPVPKYFFERAFYKSLVYDGTGSPKPETPLVKGPSLLDWPTFPALGDHLLLKVAADLQHPSARDLLPVDEFALHGESPQQLAGQMLAQLDPCYVARTKELPTGDALTALLDGAADRSSVSVGSALCAISPGAGASAMQVAGCQRLLGGLANIARTYPARKYRDLLIRWGILPLLTDDEIALDEYVLIPDIRRAIESNAEVIPGKILGSAPRSVTFSIGALQAEEKGLLLAGGMMNYYRK